MLTHGGFDDKICAKFISGSNKISMYSGVLYEFVLFSTWQCIPHTKKCYNKWI